jgi:hypothetical protein
MTRKSTLVLLISLGIFSVVVAAVGGGYWWWQQNGDALMAEARSAEAEGTRFAVGKDEQACVDEAVTRAKGGGMTAALKAQPFLTTCLGAAQPVAGFCDGVPGPDDVLKSVSWNRQRISDYGLSAFEAPFVLGPIQRFCTPGQVFKPWFQARFPDGVGATITTFAVLPDGTKTQSADVMGAQDIAITITPNHVVHRSRQNGIGCYGYDVIIEPLNDAGFLHEIFSRPRFRVSFQPYSIAMPDQAKACAAVSLPSGPLEPQTVAQGDVISLEMIAAGAQTRVKLVDEIRVSRP